MQRWTENQLRKSGVNTNEIETKYKSHRPESSSHAKRDAELPVRKHREALLDLYNRHRALIVCGETGSGKSTQIPQFLWEDQLVSSAKKLAVAQPRKLAAVSLARRVADEREVKIGGQVGYSVRFDNASSPQTVIKYLTNGMLIREILADPLLSGYGALLLDEAHERTIETDVLLGLTKQILDRRPDFKVIISSATMDSAKLSNFFDNAPVYDVPGRKFKVDVFYASTVSDTPNDNRTESARDMVVQTVMQIHTREPTNSGDILVFLAGQADIEAVAEQLSVRLWELGSTVAELIVVQLYANMPNEQQAKIFKETPPNCRKVVLATNVAETSLTIPQIRYVVDSGLVKELNHNSRAAMDTLETVYISQASAEQRAGRAGRMGPGTCYRLYTKSQFLDQFQRQTDPEILRANLSQVCLLMLSLGITDLFNFQWVDAPSLDSIVSAYQMLYALGALNQEAMLTKLGRAMAEFPLEPKLARALIAGISYDCLEEVCVVAAMLGETSSLFTFPRGKKDQARLAHAEFANQTSDQLTLFNLYEQWSRSNFNRHWCRNYFVSFRSLQRARSVKDQLLQLANKYRPALVEMPGFKRPSNGSNGLAGALVSGYFLNSARLSKNGRDYITFDRSTAVAIHPSSVLHNVDPLPAFVIYNEVVMTSKPFARGCMAIDKETVRNSAPFYFWDKLAEKS